MSGWNCRPPASYGALDRTGYLAGYSDGFHGYHFGAGYIDPPPGYRVGFEEGCRDGPNASGVKVLTDGIRSA